MSDRSEPDGRTSTPVQVVIRRIVTQKRQSCERSVNTFSLSQGVQQRLSGKARTSRRPCKAAAPKHPHLHQHPHTCLYPLVLRVWTFIRVSRLYVLIFLPNLYLHPKYLPSRLARISLASCTWWYFGESWSAFLVDSLKNHQRDQDHLPLPGHSIKERFSRFFPRLFFFSSFFSLTFDGKYSRNYRLRRRQKRFLYVELSDDTSLELIGCCSSRQRRFLTFFLACFYFIFLRDRPRF